jgi:hypothetical protein
MRFHVLRLGFTSKKIIWDCDQDLNRTATETMEFCFRSLRSSLNLRWEMGYGSHPSGSRPSTRKVFTWILTEFQSGPNLFKFILTRSHAKSNFRKPCGQKNHACVSRSNYFLVSIFIREWNSIHVYIILDRHFSKNREFDQDCMRNGCGMSCNSVQIHVNK